MGGARIGVGEELQESLTEFLNLKEQRKYWVNGDMYSDVGCTEVCIFCINN